MNNTQRKHRLNKDLFYKSLIVPLLGLTLWVSPAQAEFTTQVETQSVAVNDVFDLTLSTTSNSQSLPDLAPLEQDFQILGMSQSLQTHIINGHTTRRFNWILSLSPKKSGQLTIPSLNLDGEYSDPITLTVLGAGQVPTQNDQPLTVMAAVSEGNHYIFQEIPLTIRIESSQPVAQAELVLADIPNVDIRQQGQDEVKQIVRDGRPITVIEREYILSPQKTGQVEIPPIIVRGNYASSQYNHYGLGSGIDDLFDQRLREQLSQMGVGFDEMFGGAGEAFTATTQPIIISVQANPKGENEWFLPAKFVSLSAKWQPDQAGYQSSNQSKFKEGDVITCEINLLAVGAEPEQLPKLDIAEVEGLQIYIDSDTTEKIMTDDGIMARRSVRLSIIPERSGIYTLPEIAVDWHNTENDTPQTAVLPSDTIVVEQAAGSNNSDAAQQATNRGETTENPIDDSAIANKAQGDSTESWTYGKVIGWLVGLALLGLILAVGWWLYRKNRNKRQSTSSPHMSLASVNNHNHNEENPLTTAKTKLEEAVANENAEQVYQALFSYKQAHKQTLNQNSLNQINSLQQQLERGLYGSDNLPKFSQIAQSVQAIINSNTLSKNTATNHTSLGLPTLYPR